MLAYVFFKPVDVAENYEIAICSENPDALTIFSAPLEQAFKDIKNWAELEAMGRVMSAFGTEICIQIPINKLEDLTKFLDKFEPTTKTLFAVGIGMTPEEAYKAMCCSENENGDRVVMYDPNIDESDQIIEKAYKYGAEFGSDFDNTFSLEFAKDAEDEFGEDPPPEAGDPTTKDILPGGLADHMPDSKFDPASLKTGAKKESEEHGLDEQRSKEVAKDHLVEDKNAYDQEDPKAEKEKKSVKQKIVETLMLVKQNSDAIAQLKSIKPEAFKAVKSAIDAMILMAQSDMQKSEKSEELEETEEEFSEPPSKNKKKLAKEEPIGKEKKHRVKVLARDEATRKITGSHWHKLSDGMIMGPTGHAVSPNKPAKE